jgi:hypothetical protein
VPVDEAGLIAAAETMASWARARRATWTTEPLPSPAAAPEAAFEFVAPAPPPAVTGLALPEIKPSTVPAVIPKLPEPPRPAPPRELNPAVKQWAVRGAIAAAVVAAAAIGGPYAWDQISKAATAVRTEKAAPAAPVGPVLPPKPTAGLRATATPNTAQVLVDGKLRGVTPLSLDDLKPGKHEVLLRSKDGSVKKTVTIAAGETAVIEEAIFAGWVAVEAPFDLTIAERGKVLTADDRGQIMLPPGPHELRLTNKALAIDLTRNVDVTPGAATKLLVTPEPSSLTVTATAAAEVWVDGSRAGDTPLNAWPLPLGTHDIVVRRTGGGEKRYTLTIGSKPATLNVEF